MDTKETLKAWVREYTESLYSYAVSKIPDTDIGKDLVQDTFLAAYTGFDSYNGKSNPKTWLMGILKHKIADYYRDAYKNTAYQDSHSSGSPFFEDTGMWNAKHIPKYFDADSNLLDDEGFLYVLNDCMEKLPKKLNSVVQLKYYTNQSGNQICKDLNISATNFWQILHRAKLRMRECLEINWFKA